MWFRRDYGRRTRTCGLLDSNYIQYNEGKDIWHMAISAKAPNFSYGSQIAEITWRSSRHVLRCTLCLTLR